MTNTNKEIILETDPNAIEEITVTAYKCPDGYIYLDEKTARWYSATHRKCDSCGELYPKTYFTKCKKCLTSLEETKWLDMPHQKWDLITPVYCITNEKFFFNTSEIEDFLEEKSILPKDLRLVICEPVYLTQIEDEYWKDDLPDDGSLKDLYPEIHQSIQEVNILIQSAEPASYCPYGKFRTKFEMSYS